MMIWYYHWWYFYDKRIRKILQFIDVLEDKYNIRLTPGGRDILIIPFIELLIEGETLDLDQIKNTLMKVMEEIKKEPADVDRDDKRSSFSLFKAFHNKWCDIPPICGRTRGRKREEREKNGRNEGR